MLRRQFENEKNDKMFVSHFIIIVRYVLFVSCWYLRILRLSRQLLIISKVYTQKSQGRKQIYKQNYINM